MMMFTLNYVANPTDPEPSDGPELDGRLVGVGASMQDINVLVAKNEGDLQEWTWERMSDGALVCYVFRDDGDCDEYFGFYVCQRWSC